MREIKFRAWHKGATDSLGRDIFSPQMLFDSWPGECLLFFRQKQPVVLMQFTGLLDRNGKEIYEKDLAKIISNEVVGEEQRTYRRKTNTYSVYRDVEIVGVVEYLNGSYWLKTDQSITYKTYFYDMGRHKPTPDWQNVRNFTHNFSRQLTVTVAKACEVVGDIYTTPELLKAERP